MISTLLIVHSILWIAHRNIIYYKVWTWLNDVFVLLLITCPATTWIDTKCFFLLASLLSSLFYSFSRDISWLPLTNFFEVDVAIAALGNVYLIARILKREGKLLRLVILRSNIEISMILIVNGNCDNSSRNSAWNKLIFKSGRLRIKSFELRKRKFQIYL